MTSASLRIGKRQKIDFAWVLSGNVLYSACQWGIVLVLAKLGTAAQVGEYALAFAVSAPVVLFANLQLRVLLASDVNNKFSFGQYLTFRSVSLAGAMVAVGAIAGTQADARRASLILLMGFAQVLEIVSDIYYGLMQKYNRMDRISHSLILKGPLSLGMLAVAMYMTRSVAWAVAGLALGRLLILVSFDARLVFLESAGGARPKHLWNWNAGNMGRLLRTALPLGVISLLVALNSNVPRYFVEAYAGTADLGIFSAIFSLLTAGNLVVGAFGQSIFLPVATACANFDRVQYRAFVAQAVALGGVLGAGGILAATFFGRFILTNLFRPEYGARADIFVWLTVAGTIAFVASGLGYVMTAARSLKPQIPLLAATVLAAAAASVWLIPGHGLHGAAMAALITALVQLVGTAVILIRIDRQLRPAPGEGGLLHGLAVLEANSVPERIEA